MHLVHEDEGKRLFRSGSPWLSSYVLLLRPAAVAALGPMLLEYGEFLTIVCAEAELIFNVTRVIDTVDESASGVWRFESGRLMWVRRYVFRPDVVAGVDIFKIPNLTPSPNFVSKRVVDAWAAPRLSGLEFDTLWSG